MKGSGDASRKEGNPTRPQRAMFLQCLIRLGGPTVKNLKVTPLLTLLDRGHFLESILCNEKSRPLGAFAFAREHDFVDV
jgi:hypothetical protein